METGKIWLASWKLSITVLGLNNQILKNLSNNRKLLAAVENACRSSQVVVVVVEWGQPQPGK